VILVVSEAGKFDWLKLTVESRKGNWSAMHMLMLCF